jgi:hypothetical protein
VERGFAYYKRDYYDRGLVDPDAMVFFANWQSQAGRPLFEATLRPEVKDLVVRSSSSFRTESSRAASTIAWRAGQNDRPA